MDGSLPHGSFLPPPIARMSEETRIAVSVLVEQLDRADIAYWNWDVQREEIYWSAACRRLFGIPEYEPLSYKRFLGTVHSDDRVYVNDAVQSCLKSATTREYEFEYRITLPSGQLRWIHAKGSVTVEEKQAVRLAGISLDITRRKQSDELALLEQGRLQAVLEQLPQGVIFAEAPSGRLVLVNDQVEQITGHHFIASEGIEQYASHRSYTREGRLYSAAQWPLARSIQQGEIVTREQIRYERPDGRTVFLEASSTPIRDPNGAIIAGVVTFEDVTQQRVAEEALGAHQRLLQTVTDNATVALFIIDANQDCRFMNPAAEKMTGFTRQQVQGSSFHNILHVRGSTGGSCPSVPCSLEHLIAADTKLQHENVLIRNDGQIYEVALTASPIVDHDGVASGAVIELVNITDRKRAEEALRERERRLRLALSGGQMGTWDVDLLTDETTWDEKEYALLRYPLTISPSAAGFYARVHEEDRLPVKKAVRRAIESRGELEHHFRIVGENGEVRWLASKGLVLTDSHGHPQRLVGINYDITDLKAHAESLQLFAQELEVRVNERTAELVKSQEWLRAMATELNLAEQRERKRLADELHDHLQQLLVLAKLKLSQGVRTSQAVASNLEVMQQVNHVLTDALNYTRTLVSELSPSVLHDHGLPAAVKWLREYMKKKYDLCVTVSAPGTLRGHVPHEQALLLLQSVRELLINSWKHSGSGEAAVVLREHDGLLEIVVQDSGKGFQQAAFETPAELSSKFGLFSIRERMRALGGSLEIESAPGSGTRARMAIPMQGESQRNPPLLPGKLTLNVAMPESPDVITVLLVDDHAMVRQGLRSLLEGYPVLQVIGEASNGEEALDTVEKHRPDVVLMDINMPGMNGVEATRRISQRFPKTIIIGLSVNAEGESREAMIQAGCYQLLTKEAAVDQLYTVIQQAMKGVRE